MKTIIFFVLFTIILYLGNNIQSFAIDNYNTEKFKEFIFENDSIKQTIYIKQIIENKIIEFKYEIIEKIKKINFKFEGYAIDRYSHLGSESDYDELLDEDFFEIEYFFEDENIELRIRVDELEKRVVIRGEHLSTDKASLPLNSKGILRLKEKKKSK